MAINFDDTNYNKELSSHEWQRTRESYFEAQGNECQFCGRTENLQLHHVDYSKLPEFVCLCEGCHKIVSNMVVNYNSLSYERVDKQFTIDFIVDVIKTIYEKQYCHNPNKSFNFLNPDQIELIKGVLVRTLQAQFKSSDPITRVAIENRLSSLTGVRAKVQKTISDSRQRWVNAAKKKYSNDYMMRFLGIDYNKLRKYLYGYAAGGVFDNGKPTA